MTHFQDQLATVTAPPDHTTVRELARRLAAGGLAVQCSSWRDTCKLTILGVVSGKSHLALSAGGHAHWYYEPAAGPATSPAALAAIIAYLLGASRPTASLVAYRAFPLKGAVGRSLQDIGLTVTLHVSEDLESFEATTQIGVTSPGHPWLGTVCLADDAGLDWHCNWRAAFGGNTGKLADVITPILCTANGLTGDPGATPAEYRTTPRWPCGQEAHHPSPDAAEPASHPGAA